MSQSEDNNLLRRAGEHEAHANPLSVFPGIEDLSPVRREYKSHKPIPFDGLLTNKLLTALPGEDFARLLPHLEPVSLFSRHDVYELGKEIDFVYFPETAIISQIHTLEDGSTREAAIIGNEGMGGLSSILDSRAPSYWTQVTIGGTAVKVSREVIKREFGSSAAVQQILLRYLHCLLSQVSLRAVCNGCHKLDERLSTWLLMVHDRANGELLHLTHEEIACHLGARRAGITASCNELRANGAIEYRRGVIRILNRESLETAACECYQTLKECLL